MFFRKYFFQTVFFSDVNFHIISFVIAGYRLSSLIFFRNQWENWIENFLEISQKNTLYQKCEKNPKILRKKRTNIKTEIERMNEWFSQQKAKQKSKGHWWSLIHFISLNHFSLNLNPDQNQLILIVVVVVFDGHWNYAFFLCCCWVWLVIGHDHYHHYHHHRWLHNDDDDNSSFLIDKIIWSDNDNNSNNNDGKKKYQVDNQCVSLINRTKKFTKKWKPRKKVFPAWSRSTENVW